MLDENGNLLIAGGYHKTNLSSNNYLPTASVWLIPVGQTTITRQGAAQRWIWLLILAALIAAAALSWLYWRKKVSGQHLAGSTDATSADLSSSSQPDADLYARICDLMSKQQLFRNPELKAADVAAALGTSTRYVIDSIRTGCGQTFSQLVNSYRIDYAKHRLLQSPGKALVEIYDDAGFSSERSFFRAFKDTTGMTTREWLSSQQP